MLGHDFTFAVRRLRSSPGFTAAAVITLALGIGANTTIFSLVNAVVFRSFGVERPNELVFFNTRLAKGEFPGTSYPDYEDYRDRNTVLNGLAMYHIAPVNVSREGGENTRFWGYEVTGNYFDLLGVRAVRGRLLRPEDDAGMGAHPVAVLTYNCWQTRFGADPDIAGKKVKIDGLDYTIVGVAPPSFVGTELIFTPELFVPVAMEKQVEGSDWVHDRHAQQAWAIGRLKPGVSMKAAEADINSIAAQLGREHPEADAGMTVRLSPPGMAGTFLRGAINGFSAVLLVVAGMVLLTACVNIAGLLLARASDRRKETAIRVALGASRGQLVRQLLTESLVMSMAGGAAGILLALWLTDLVNIWRPPVDVPVIPHVAIDAHVLVFAAVSSLLTSLLFGLAPALQSTRASLAGAIKNDPPSDRFRRVSLRDVLVAAQVALSAVLLVGSVLVVRSLQHALSLNLGFDPRHAATLSYDLGGNGYTRTQGREFQRRLLEKLRATPGIEAAGIIDGMPLTLSINYDSVLLEGKPEPRPSDVPLANAYVMTPGYLKAMRTRLISGRDFDERDSRDAPKVAIVNEAFARQLLPGEDPVGKRFRHNDGEPWIQIVGVVEDGKYRSLGENPSPTMFTPMEQNWRSTQQLIARSPLDEAETTRLLRRTVAELDPSLTVYEAGSVTERLGLALFPVKLAAVVLGSFGFLAVILAATGVYGITAYAVSRRTREIGIRMALGADPGQVLRVVLIRTGVLLGIGAAAGFALAFGTGKFFGQILYGVSAHDPVTYLSAIALMAVVALAACCAPALRAIRIDPLTALRTE